MSVQANDDYILRLKSIENIVSVTRMLLNKIAEDDDDEVDCLKEDCEELLNDIGSVLTITKWSQKIDYNQLNCKIDGIYNDYIDLKRYIERYISAKNNY